MTSNADRSLIAHLLRRTGFGASGPEIDAAYAAGYASTVDALFATTADSGAAATPAPGLPSSIDTSADADLITWWLARMTAARNPWPEKRTYFWHGHFATSLQKVRYASLMLKQNQTMRTLGGGDFHTLFRAVLTDPAMMLWLDAEGSTQAALALTGWRLNRVTGDANFSAKNHAPGPETILGKTASFDADSFADLVLSQSASPEFVVARHWFRLGSAARIPTATQQSLLTAYGAGRDLSALARALFTDASFTGTTARSALVKQPVEYVVGVLRALKISPTSKDAPTLRSVLNGLGQLPFYPPNVGGWPSGQLWLTTAALQARIDFARWAASTGDLSTVADASTGSRIDAVGYLLGVDGFSTRTVSALSDVVADPPSLVALALLSPEYQVN